MSKNSRLVYSTESGRIDAPSQSLAPPDSDGIVRIQRSSKGRGGKSVSVITGLGLGKGELKTLAKALKQVCGVGGSVKDWDIEIQGDMRDKLKTELEKRGYTVKLAGG
ncbi:stress response translation initiation inhibitor YciH [Simiduia aestuariiviva]|uniref:Translation initiation factor 1 n=1 Tax=Simiduia aestuariiviva TaxID=1510459 RepID=A0A839UL58_9GAMM|nr:stress response translation initiation inhibitor YciH [Simiduia aestuariiviva]MBB3168894.1 translation initiation factor 1 [Simiduia aestuariiviva]